LTSPPSKRFERTRRFGSRRLLDRRHPDRFEHQFEVKARTSWKSSDDYRSEYEAQTRTVLETGGRIITLNQIQDAKDAFREILAKLREQYVLGYYPTDNRDEVAWHRVAVRVQRGGLLVRERGGYIDF
jgi:hypothetical protein